MRARRTLVPLALALLASACSDQVGPLPAGVQQPALEVVASEPAQHILRQSPTAPRLQTYQMSYWARRGSQTTISVRYRRRPGEWISDEFLRFRIPINGLVAGANGVPLERGDSVRITLTIDSLTFKVDFQPSGVVFSRSSPALLGIWYKNANPDLNNDGVVNAVDAALETQLAIWSRENRNDPWKQLSSGNDPTEKLVTAALQHFSQYAVSW